LRRVSTGENLREPQELPEDWEGIFGLESFKDRLGDLSWLKNPALNDIGWFDTGIPVPPLPVSEDNVSKEIKAKRQVKILLTESDWSMLSDVPMSRDKKTQWEEYRRALREIKLQPGFPDSIFWPSIPE